MKKIVLYVGAFLFSIAGYAQQALWRITNQKISSDMEILSHKLEKMEKEICDAI